ncbi:MAG: hypothetical protein QXV17_12420 [Candidatus Micrarchaeaceae archaeon]
MGIGKTIGTTIVILAILFTIWYLFFSNQTVSLPFITSSNNTYQNFKSYISNVTGIPVKNITNMTTFPDMQEVILIIPNNTTYTKIPYNNSYVYATNNFTLTFPKDALLFNVTNNSIINVVFAVATKQEYQNINFYNLTYQKSLPRIIIPYYVYRNNLSYTFKIYNQNNYPSNITLQQVPINTYIITTLGIIYKNNFYMTLYK